MDDYEPTDAEFDMGAPFALNPDAPIEHFAFWFSTNVPYLIEFVRAQPCVRDVREPADDADHQDDLNAHFLVEIDNEFDPDEAWHWIRTDLEDEVNNSGLDAIWREAIWLL